MRIQSDSLQMARGALALGLVAALSACVDLPGITRPMLRIPTVPDLASSAGVSQESPAVAAEAPSSSTGHGGPSCFDDAQCMTPADVIVCTDFCYIGHLLKPPSPESKGQALFLLVKDGSRVWADRWFETRSLRPGEAVGLDQRVAYFRRWDDGVMLPPRSHEDAIKGEWYISTVTDLSDLFKRQVHVAREGMPVQVTALRLIVRAGAGAKGSE